MNRIFMKAVSLLLACMLLDGCGASTAVVGTASAASASETSASAATEENVAAQYTALPEDNVFYEADQDSLLKMLQHGTGIIMIGFPECPWCQTYAVMLNDVAVSAGTRVMYYNILEDRQSQNEFYQQEIGRASCRERV